VNDSSALPGAGVQDEQADARHQLNVVQYWVILRLRRRSFISKSRKWTRVTLRQLLGS